MKKALNWIPLVIIAFISCIFLWLLGNVLIPFVVAAYLSYLGNPLVHTLMNYGLPRTVAVIIVFIIIIFIFIGLWFLIIPLIKNQIAFFLLQLPSILIWLQKIIQPILQKFSFVSQNISFLSFRENFLQYLPQTQNVAGEILGTLSKSGSAILSALLNILLVPVVTFYFLRDWDTLLEKQKSWLNFPSTSTKSMKWISYWREVDQVLRGFLRGQLFVMLILGFAYSLALSALGIPLSFLIGMSAGLLSLVPFLGFMVGIILASLMAVLQFHDWIHIIYVCAVFIGFAVIENMILVPLLLGESLGLHPIIVIFSILAGGELFGVLGVLLALPSAAIIKVSLRHVFIHLKENPNHSLQSL